MSREHGTTKPESQEASLRSGENTRRKVYNPPRLRLLGDVNAITAATVKSGGGEDGARKKPQG